VDEFLAKDVKDHLQRPHAGILHGDQALLYGFDADAVVADLAFLLELVEHLKDRTVPQDLGGRTMDLIEVDALSAKAPEAAFAIRAHLLFRVVFGVVDVARPAELRGDKDLVRFVGGRLAEELFAPPISVDIGGVKEVDAEVDRPVNGAD